MSDLSDPSMEPVTRLGRALGVLDRSSGSVDTGWFQDPFARIVASLHKPEAIEDVFLAVAALGSAVPDVNDPSVRRFVIADTKVAVLLKRAGARLALGVGAAHANTEASGTRWAMSVELWVFAWDPKAPTTSIDVNDIDYNPSARASVLVAPGGAAPPLKEIAGSIEAKATFNAGTAVDGDVSLDFALTPPTGAPVTLQWDLKDTLADPVQQLVPLAVAVVVGLLRILLQQSSSASAISKLLSGVLRLVGAEDLAGTTSRLPPPPVSDILANGPQGMQKWLVSLFTGAPDLGKAAIENLMFVLTGGQALSTLEGDAAVIGVPDCEKGWSAAWLLPAPMTGFSLALVAVRSRINNVPTLRVGVRVGAMKPIKVPVSGADVDFDLIALAECLAITIPLEGAPAVRLDGATRLLGLVNDNGATGDHTIVSVNTSGVSVSVGGFEGGVRFAPGAKPSPVLALTDVTAPAPIGNHDRYDLLDLDNAAKLGAAAGGALLLAALAAAGVDLNAVADVGKAVGALIGLIAPPGATAAYPLVVPADILSDPSAAWRAWLGKMLVETNGVRPLTSWLDLLYQTLNTLTGTTLPPRTGAGSVADPYVFTFHASAPVLTLRFSLPPSSAGRLAFRVEFVGRLDHQALGGGANPPELDTSVVFGLLDAEVPAPTGGAGAPALTWVPSVYASSDFHPKANSGPFALTVPAPANLTVSVAGVDLRFGWDRTRGLQPELLGRDVQVTRGGNTLLDLDALSLRALVEGTGDELPASIAVATTVGLATVSPEAADRALAVVRFLGLTTGTATFAAVDLPRFNALLRAPDVELPKLWLERLSAAAWTSGPLFQDAVALPWNLVFGHAGDPAQRPSIHGAGTPERPWALPLRPFGDTASTCVELLTWLGPAGPPSAPADWVNSLVPVATTNATLAGALDAVAAFDSDVAGAALGVTGANLADSLRGIGGALGVGAATSDIVTELRRRLDAIRTASAARAAPDRIGFGLGVSTAVTTGGFTASSRLRLGLFTVGITAASRVEGKITALFESTLTRQGGWLLGDASADTRLRALKLTLRWSEASGFGFEVRFYDLRVRGFGGDNVGLDDARAGAAIEALRAAQPGLFVAAGAAGAIAGLLAGIGLADEAAGAFSLLAGPVQEAIAATPGDLSARIRDALIDPASGAPRMAVFGPVLERLGAVTTANGAALGCWRFSLGALVGHALSLDVMPDATLRFSAGTLAAPSPTHADVLVSFAPLTRTLDVSAGVHPIIQGSPFADLRFELHTGAALSSPAPTLKLLPLRDPAPALLGAGLSLVPPQPDLLKKSLEVLGMVAAGLFVRFVVEAKLLPILPQSIFDLLKKVGLLTGTSVADRHVGDLAGLLADPAAFFTTDQKLSDLTTSTLKTIGSFETGLTYSNPPGDTGRSVQLVFRTRDAGGVSLADFNFKFNTALVLDLPEQPGRPTGIRPVLDGNVSARIGAGGPSLGVRAGFDGTGPTFALLASPSGSNATVAISLLPWGGIGDTIVNAARDTLLPLALAEIVKKLRAATDVATKKVGEALAQLLGAIGAADPTAVPFAVDGQVLIGFVKDPASAWRSLYDPTFPSAAAHDARLLSLQSFVQNLFQPFGLTGSIGTQMLTLPLGAAAPVALMLGHNASKELTFAIKFTSATFPSALVNFNNTAVGVHLSKTDGGPSADFVVSVGFDLDVGTLSGGSPFRALLAVNGGASTSGALTLGTTLRLSESAAPNAGIEVLAVDVLPAFGLRVGGGIVTGLNSAEVVLGDVVLPAVLLVLCVPAVAAHTLDLDLVPGAVTLRLGDLLGEGGAKLLRRSGARWEIGPRADRYSSVVLTVVGLLAQGARSVTGLPVGIVSGPLGTGIGLLTNATPTTLIPRPEVSLLRAWDPIAKQTSKAALTAYLLGPGSSLAFRPGLVLDGFGVKIAGNDGGALMNDPVGLGAVELRTQLRLVSGETANKIRVGAALMLRDLRFDMGGGGGTSSNNPVASALFSERSTSPGFSLQLGYVWGPGPDLYNVEDDAATGSVELLIPEAPAGSGMLWIPVNAKIGPLEIQRFGLKLEGPVRFGTAGTRALSLALDARFSLGPLTVECWGLGVKIEFKQPPAFTFLLDGLAVMYQSGEIMVAGAFLHNPPAPPTRPFSEYAGAAIIRVPSFELQAVGAYTTVVHNGKNEPSFFIFARVNVALGGPPFFFVMGFAGGFGFNRSITLPKTFADIPKSPFMKLIGSSGELVTQLNDIVSDFPAKPGAYWFAAGVNFRSFVLINGTALLYVLLDDGFTLGLLGRAELKLPTASNPIVSIVLALDAGFSTTNDDPRLWVTAQLTDESFLIHPDVKIRGGFALYIWFKRGDFVLSIGGYCNAFNKPAHYPDVDRVGITWQTGGISVKGGVYFAITPREAMGGCEVSVTGEWGPVKAWLTIELDMIIGWDPFYYYFHAKFEIGGSIDLWFCEPEFSLGIDLTVQGPRFGGRGRVKICGIGVTIRFGASDDAPKSPIPLGAWAQKALNSSNTAALPGVFALEATKGRFTAKGDGNTSDDANDSFRAVLMEATLSLRTKIPGTSGAFVTRQPAGVTSLLTNDAPDEAQNSLLTSLGATRSTLDLVPSNKDEFESKLTLTLETSVAGNIVRMPRAWRRTSAQPVALYAIGGTRNSVRLIEQIEITLESDMAAALLNKEFSSTEVDTDVTYRLPFARAVRGNIADLKAAHNDWTELHRTAATRLVATSRRNRERIAESVLKSQPVLPTTWGAEPGFVSAPAALTIAPPLMRFVPPLAAPTMRAFYRSSVAWAAPTSTRTVSTVARVASARNAPRVAAPGLKARGARMSGLELVTTGSRNARAPAASSMSAVPRSRDPQLYGRPEQALREGAFAVAGGDVVVVDVARGARQSLKLRGDQALRVVMLSASCAPLLDADYPAGSQDLAVAPEVARVAVQGLGRLDVQAPERASPGGASSLLASHARGASPAIGFDADHPLVMLGDHTWLARGAVLRIHAGSRADLRAGTHVATEVLARATEVSVHLGAPRGCVVVTAIRSMAAVDRDADALSVQINDQNVNTRNVRGIDGRVAQVIELTAGGPTTVSVSLSAGWTLTGVMAVPDTAETCVADLASRSHWNLVEDGPPGPGGRSTLQMENVS